MNQELFDFDHLGKTYFKFAFPVVMGLVVTLIYNLADTFFIAQTNDTLLVAGVSLCSPVFTTIMAFGNIYGQGGSSLISRLLGKKDKDGIHRISSFCFYIALVTGILLGILMLLFHEPLLHMIGANDDTYTSAYAYFMILAMGTPCILLSFIHSNLLRCEGLSTQSMLGSIVGTVLNIILDPILISGFQMGAAGAAIATIIGYIVSDVYFIYVVKRKSQWLSLNPHDFQVNKSELKQIFGVGITAAITNWMQSLCIIVMNQYLLPYGNDKIAAMGIVLKVNMISQLILTGFAFGSVPLFGYLYGSNNQKKMKELLLFCMKFLAMLSILLTVCLCVGAPVIMKAMMNNANIIEDGTRMLRYQVAGTLFASIVLLFTCFFQATAKIIPAFLLSISRQGILFLVVLLLFVHFIGYEGILVSQLIADILGACLALLLYVKAFRKKPMIS